VSLTPTDDTEPTAASRPESTEGTGSPSVRSRIRSRLRRGALRTVAACGRALRWLTRSGSEDGHEEAVALADSAVSPPDCSAIEEFPPRAFPLSYPTRSYRTVDNGVDLDADSGAETLTISHPDRPSAYIESDTWIEVER